MSNSENGGAETQAALMILRCECGVVISAKGRSVLVDRARLHFSGAHPDLGADIPEDLILAMAEEEVHK